MNRKDDHIKFALKQDIIQNDFDKIRFVHHGLQNLAFEEVSLCTSFCGFKIDYPIFINAMTGGTEQAKEINAKLSLLAKHFNIPMASGSLSIALRDPSLKESFTVIRDNNPSGIIIANIGADKSLADAKKAIEILDANVLQIHINQVQEMLMPEGERDFRNWLNNINEIASNVDVPVIVKEVGFGMNRRTLNTLKRNGIKTIDISGRGGTNFSRIENERRDFPMSYMDDWGLSTVESMLEASNVNDLEIIASGGVRNPMDVVKVLALGAKTVGISSYFLKLVNDNSIEQSIKKLDVFLMEVQTIMTILGAKIIEELKHVELIFDKSILDYMLQRNISTSIITTR